ncbi:MAG: polysaccharide biosynthesis C-terminal domain-containing protein, partial [Acidobacteria bacterium]|nr:polysaccharide biosynthesis C-terminal domain-containing protein [Acidobacteriota bacterium]
MYVSIGSILVHAPTSFGMMYLLSGVGVSPERPNGYGHVGVALATSTVALVNFFALTFLMRRRIGRLNGRDIISGFVKVAAAAAVMSAVCYFSYRVLTGIFLDKSLVVRLIEAFIPIGLGGVVFVIAAKLLRVDELEKLLAVLRKKLGRGA